MPIVTIEQARAHVRVEDDYPAEQLQAAIDGAQDAAQAYLNRAIYEDQEALDTARAGYAAGIGEAAQARDDALAAASQINDPVERCAAIEMANLQHREAVAAADRCIHGIVVNPSIKQAILLRIGSYYAIRADGVVGATVAELPMGAQSLLRPYRRVMMP